MIDKAIDEAFLVFDKMTKDFVCGEVVGMAERSKFNFKPILKLKVDRYIFTAKVDNLSCYSLGQKVTVPGYSVFMMEYD